MYMGALSKEYRRQLERAVLAAREEAERGAAAALESYGVGEAKKPTHLDKAGEDLRKKLRARGRQAGDLRRPDDSQEVGNGSSRNVRMSTGIGCCSPGSWRRTDC
jgi:hypothetical protein